MSSREAFEAWVDSNFPFKKDRFDLFRGEYKSQFTEQLWQSWQASREGLDAKLKSAENNDVDARCHVAELEAKCAALAAENAGLKVICEDRRTFIMNGVQLGYIKVPTVETDPALETIRVAVSPQEPTPATDAFLAEVRASAIPDEATERDLFEEWVMEKICVSKTTLEGLRTDDGYRNSTLSGTDYNGMWSQWKAIRAAQLQKGAAL